MEICVCKSLQMLWWKGALRGPEQWYHYTHHCKHEILLCPSLPCTTRLETRGTQGGLCKNLSTFPLKCGTIRTPLVLGLRKHWGYRMWPGTPQSLGSPKPGPGRESFIGHRVPANISLFTQALPIPALQYPSSASCRTLAARWASQRAKEEGKVG